LFWLTVGAATLAEAMAQNWLAAAAFLCGFYLLLVGSKVLVVLLAARSCDLLAGRPYRVVMASLRCCRLSLRCCCSERDGSIWQRHNTGPAETHSRPPLRLLREEKS
jgi:hypothetical protein